MCVLGVEGSEKECAPPRIISGTALRALPEIILRRGWAAGTFLSCRGGGCFVGNVSEGWKISLTNPVRGWRVKLSGGSRCI